MGLDMYLTKHSYVKNWDHYKPEQRYEITVNKGGQPYPGIKPERISCITEEVAYWRKANAIHKWFVEKVQGGRDECQESYVEVEQLAELVRLCKEVLNSVETVDGDVHVGTRFTPDAGREEMYEPGRVVAQAGLAERMLPTQGGFFFGSTDYDEGYLADLRSTVEQLEPLLTEGGDGDFYYRASW